MRLYLSGPITGTTDYVERFARAGTWLRARGYEVVDPVAATPEGLSYGEYMRRDLILLLACEGVALLPGYEVSRGSQLEAHVARTCGLPTRSLVEWVARSTITEDEGMCGL